MRIIGFNLTKVSAEKFEDSSVGSEINTNIDFTNIEKEETDLANEGNEAIRTSFKFEIFYGKKDKKDKEGKNGEVAISGFIILLATKEEAKDVFKNWKNKEILPSFKIPLLNFLLNKCSTKALQLEEEVGLPLHIPMPHLKPSQPEDKK